MDGRADVPEQKSEKEICLLSEICHKGLTKKNWKNQLDVWLPSRFKHNKLFIKVYCRKLIRNLLKILF